MNPSEDPSDRLVDSLLKAQSRGKADEDLLRSIEEKLHATGGRVRRRPRSTKLPWLAAAAAVVLGGFGMLLWQSSKRVVKAEQLEAAQLAVREKPGVPVGRVVENAERGLTPLADPLVRPESVNQAAAEGKNASVYGHSSGASIEAELADAGRQKLPGETPMSGLPPAVTILDPFSESAPAESIGLGSVSGGGRGTGDGTGSRIGVGALIPSVESGRTGVLADEADPFAEAGGFVVPGEELASQPLPRTRVIPPPPGKTRQKPLDDGLSRENYGRLVDQPWKSPWQDALSTFSIDVDTASYTNLRRMILEGRPVPADAVRIEECVNYFDYKYEGPKGDGPFAVHGQLATCPWKPQHLLARVAIKGREVDAKARPASNLVFLIDVSGSMQDPQKLPLVKRSIRVLIDQLDERDRVGMVVYAGSEGVVLEPTLLDERGKSAAIQALEKLEAGGATNGGAGIKRAYALASKHLVRDGVNRVILATDGDFNVGTTGQGELVKLVKKGADGGVSLTVAGFGAGNLNDAMMEAITNEGNGNYFYIDGDQEARRVFLQKLTGTLVTIAKDVKIQVEFNPGKVQAYRLIGYANRILRHEDFANDKVDAGDIGAGHTVTAFYEIVPTGVAMPDTGSVDALRYQKPAGKEAVASDDWFTLKLRHKHPEGEVSSLIEAPVKGEPVVWEQAGSDFRFASAVALFGMKLRQMPEMADVSWNKVMEIARPALAEDPQEQRAGFVEMVSRHSKLPVPAMESVHAESPLDGLRFVRDESVMWYVQFGMESGGKWAPKLQALPATGKLQTNRVIALEMIEPGDTFFKEGMMAGRFKFLGIVEEEIVSERTKLMQKVKFAQFEDLKPNKKGERYRSQYGLPDANLRASAYYDRTAVMEFEGKEFKVEERTRFSLPPGGEGEEFLLKQVTPEKLVVEFKGADGKLVVREIAR